MAKHTPLVSILIPCYNYGQYIEKCIQSTLDQTYENIEVIVVDNGSTDDSLEKINLFSNNKKIKIIKIKENIPPVTDGVSAIGIAIEESKGSYISILYADDWYLPEKIEKQVSLFNIMPNSVGVVYCHGYYYIEESKTKVEHKRQSVRGYVFKDYLTKGDIAMPISPLVKRYCYDIIGFDNIPIFTTSIIDKKGCAYLGVGEVVAGPTGAAISNALCNALGQRIKTLPFTKDNITKELLN